MFRIFGFSLVLFLTFTINTKGQNNIIISKRIDYRIITEKNGTDTIRRIIFDDAATTSVSADIPFLRVQRKVSRNIDSVEINIFGISYKNQDHLPSKEKIKNLPETFYKITTSRGEKYLTVFILPYRLKNNTIKAIENIRLMITVYTSEKPNGIKGSTKWADHSVLSKGNWYKVKISSSGIYKITGSELSAMGFGVGNISIGEIRLYGNGGGMMPEANSDFFYDDLKENAIEVHDINGNGKFDNDDYFLFYGQGPNIWKYSKTANRFGHSQNIYDNYAYYFITTIPGNGLRITTLPQNTGTITNTATDFIDFLYHDNDSLNLIKSGKQWFGEEYNIINGYNFSFNFPNIKTSKPAKVKLYVAARSTTPSGFNITINGVLNQLIVPAISGNYNSNFAREAKNEFTAQVTSPTITVNTSYLKSTSASIGWLDYIEVSAYRNLIMTGNQMSFRNTDVTGTGNITKFILSNAVSNIKIWDITNHVEPKEISYTLNGNTLTFIQATDSLREFIAFKGGYKSVTNVGTLPNQDLHGTGNTDMVICYYSGFKTQAEQLADFHRTRDSLKVVTVEQSLLFNEFSSGAQDIAALRNFMKMLYDRALSTATTPPRYLLLFGDASYDYKNRIQNNTNKILTFESPSSLSPTSSYSSDDFFGLLDDNEGANCDGALDIGIGRFPVNTVSEANLILDKIKRYTDNHKAISTGNGCSGGNTKIKNLADWRNIVCFIGDDQDHNIHVTQADFLANMVNSNYPVYNIDKIFLDSYVQQTTPGGQRYPDAKRDLNNRVNKGALTINYTGHGGEIGLAHESLLDINDIQSWNNSNNMPLFITATCEFSRYDDPGRTSAGEYTFLQPKGGMIALLTTSRLTYSGSNFTINKVIINNIYKKTNGSYPTLGDINRISKVGAGSITGIRNFVLLGDPALKLSYPEYKVVTTKINDTLLSNFTDTIGALAKVTISGHIENNNNILTSFNGYLYPTIYDKPQKYTTLGQDWDSYPYEFEMQKNIIYKGKVSIKNGEFKFSFIVPKDINYSIGFGKISYYAENGQTDANGYYDSIIIGGNSDNNIVDNSGPVIIPFMNDTNFVSGGITDQNPTFLAFISDENGINTTGNGIGHDIMLTLDNNTAESVQLNSFYQSDIDSYKSGYVRYPLSNLSDGHHTISLKVWDILNNSNTASIDFIVASNENILISEVINYPNPFTEYTNFIFEHNMECTKMDVEIQIYDKTGRLVRVLSTEITDPGFRISDSELKWNGRSQYGSPLATGIYSYRLIVKTNNSQNAIKSGKIVYMN